MKDDVLSPEAINEMEEKRISMLNEAGIDEQSVLESSRERHESWDGYFNENMVRGKDDVNFVVRDQWTAIERGEFNRLFKPAMTFNKTYDSVKKIIAEERKNRPDLIVRSLTGKATQDQINLRTDLVRTISYQSQNDLVYQTAFKSALTMGYGAFQVLLEYDNPRSFFKIPRYDVITDATRCSWDPSALKPHKGDGNNCSRRYVMSKEQFFATYPYITNPISYTDPRNLLDFQTEFYDFIVICDEFVKEWFPLKIYKLSNGKTVTEDQWEAMQEQIKVIKEIGKDSEVGKIINRDIPVIVDERLTQDYRIMHYRLLQNQIIEFSEWPSKQLPIIYVDGDSYYVEGRQYTKSFIHEARDAQKLFNYARSEMAAELKNRRREQWIATPDNILGYEQMWRNPEVQIGALIAKPDPKTGMMPQKMPAWEISQGLFASAESASKDLREILGFSETEELQGRDISGKARRERKVEGSMSAYVFLDNLYQAVAQGGRVVNDLLYYIFSDNEERDMIVTGADGKTRPITINEKMPDGTTKNQIEEGEFDVEIDAGPSFSVQKDMALEFFQQTVAAAQDQRVFNLVADLWADNLDIQNRPQVVERFKTLVPPQILAKEKGEPPPPPKPSPQEQMMQMEMQEKAASLKERAHELQIREQKHELEKLELLMKAKELQDKMRSDHADRQVEREKADLNFTAEITKTLADIHKHFNPQQAKRASE